MFDIRKRHSFCVPDSIRSIALYGALASITSFLGILQALVYSKVLGPSTFGLYAALVTVSSYATLLQMGLLSGLNRELPIAYGRRKYQDSLNLVGQVTTGLIFISAAAILGSILTFFLLPVVSTGIRFAILFGIALGCSSLFFQLAVLRLRAKQLTTRFALMQFSQKVFTLVLGVAAAHYFGFPGLALSLVAVNVGIYIFASFRLLENVVPLKPSFSDMLELIRLGMPIMLVGFINTVMISLDKLFLMGIVTPADLGIYQFSVLPLNLGIIANGITSQYIVPKLLYDFGLNGSLHDVVRRSAIVSLLVAFAFLVLWPLAKPIVNFIITTWLPEYQRSMELIPIFYIGAAFMAGNLMGAYFLAARLQKVDFMIALACALFCLCGFLLAVFLNCSLKWYALISVSGIFLFYLTRLGVLVYCFRKRL